MHHTVGEVMRTNVVTVDTRASLQEAQSLMEEHRVRRLPVLDDDGDLVGILSWGDVREATSVESSKTASPYAPEAEEAWLTVWEVHTPSLQPASRSSRCFSLQAAAKYCRQPAWAWC